jgi:hypothetical protein
VLDIKIYVLMLSLKKEKESKREGIMNGLGFE